MKKLCLPSLIIIVLWCPGALAQNTSHEISYKAESNHERLLPKPLFDSIVFGVEAGTICGIAAITGFHHNFRQNLDFHNVSRGASYGLYAGILLGLYITYWADLDDEKAIQSTEAKTDESSAMTKLYYQKHQQRKTGPEIHLSPLFSESKVTGFVMNWTVVRF